MTFKQAQKELIKLGFKFNNLTEKFGTIAAEPYSNEIIKNNHWSPGYRSVYIAHDYPKGPYITSAIQGKYRRYKARKYNEYDREFGNIFAHGNETHTLKEAVENFVKAFKNKEYNGFPNLIK